MERHKDDPLVLQLLGLSRLPDVSTVTCRLLRVDRESIRNVRQMNRELVLDPLATKGLSRLIMDFDGSMLSTGRFAK